MQTSLLLIPVLIASLFFQYATAGRDLQNASWVTGERALYHFLDLQGTDANSYDPYVRPVRKQKDSLKVEFGMTLVAIEDLDEKTQVLSSHVWLKFTWIDIQLQWKPEDYEGLTEIRIPIKQLWTPDIVLYNALHNIYEYSSDVLAVVYSNGMVLWIPQILLRSRCNLDLTDFPFDTHRCHLKFGSWTYSSDQVNITKSAAWAEDLSFYSEHVEWELEKMEVERNDMEYACCPGVKYPDVSYFLTLKRRPTYLTHLFVAPAVVMAFLIPVVFILPSDSKEKIFLGAAILVGQILLLDQMQQFIPSAHPTVPRLGLYYMVVIILASFSLVFGAIVANIWDRSQRKVPVPPLLRSLFLGILGRVFCVTRDNYMPLQGQDPVNFRRLEVMSDQENNDTDSAAGDKASMVHNYARLTAMSEWRQLAVVIDRLCFLVFIIVVLVVTISIIH